MRSVTGLVGVYVGSGWVSKLIRFFGRASVSHMMIGFWDEFVLEATMPRTKVSRYSPSKMKKVVWYRVSGLKKSDAEIHVKNVCTRYIDVRYGFWEIILWAIAAVWKKLTGRIPFKNLSKTRVVCAELVLYYLRDELKLSELNTVNLNDPEFMAEIHAILEKSKRFKKVTIDC